MSGPRTRFIGGRPTEVLTEVLTVDYTTVLRQAVENERMRVLREVRNALANTEIAKPSGRNSWDSEPIHAKDFRDAIYKRIDTLELARTDVGGAT